MARPTKSRKKTDGVQKAEAPARKQPVRLAHGEQRAEEHSPMMTDNFWKAYRNSGRNTVKAVKAKKR